MLENMILNDTRTATPHRETNLTYLDYCKKQDALETILDLENSKEWVTILCDYSNWLEDAFTDTRE
jgi:hypothetical protein